MSGQLKAPSCQWGADGERGEFLWPDLRGVGGWEGGMSELWGQQVGEGREAPPTPASTHTQRHTGSQAQPRGPGAELEARFWRLLGHLALPSSPLPRALFFCDSLSCPLSKYLLVCPHPALFPAFPPYSRFSPTSPLISGRPQTEILPSLQEK